MTTCKRCNKIAHPTMLWKGVCRDCMTKLEKVMREYGWTEKTVPDEIRKKYEGR